MTYIYGGFGGRFDQEMGVINALCVWGKKETFRRTTLVAYDEQTCAVVLPESPMRSEIVIRFPGVSYSEDEDEMHQTCRVGEGPTCGLIPIMGRCERVVTTGLQWNLDGDVPLEFGGLVSSSNRVVNRVVTVESSSPLLFTAEITVKHE
jgi:thiamine pyrophosphokinase